jgi:hypothetical protein
MPKIEKSFSLTMSKKFPDGGLISASFSTGESRETRDDLSLDQLEEAKKMLAARVHANTVIDLQETVKKDPIVRSIWKEVKENLRFEQKVAKAEKELDTEDT